ncbi:hypothetical protein C7Y69_18310 [Alteromonas sp. KS69]|jgi:hypothetical protein|uniref:hypothetical protein n=1 Tax=unclassified Alteromonas TaxID=2614992 RepID=UPI000C653E8C|nr:MULTISPECIES: hypothetical protein [unclassified Alteromonas]MBB66537.1 hypothetical protein [Rickettsiales bacterium]MBO7924499.1 hypothetical protein [Alteromonas sp. K632G]RUP75929.1 hypothetical protein C7Y69_18310 [Alteromonas sp. KS69]|tara:strand:+ start:10166 stop:10555 length:390 start_codon:yes stop_codon:yes gene_type:complete
MWPTVRTNATHLLSAFRSEPAWLFGDIDALMPEDLTAEEQIDYVKSALQKTTTLVINKQKIPVETVSYTSHSEALPHDAELVLQSRHTFAHVDEVTLSLSKALGSVHTSFVKPQYQRVGAGESATVKYK